MNTGNIVDSLLGVAILCLGGGRGVARYHKIVLDKIPNDFRNIPPPSYLDMDLTVFPLYVPCEKFEDLNLPGYCLQKLTHCL
jgi:hypothetical protein